MKDRMTDMPVSGLVLRLAIPSIITMMVSNLYNMVACLSLIIDSEISTSFLSCYQFVKPLICITF